MYRFEIGPILTTPPKSTATPNFAESTPYQPITEGYYFDNASLSNEVTLKKMPFETDKTVYYTFFLKTPFFPEHNYGSFPRKLPIDRLQHQNCHFIGNGRRINNDLHEEEKANYHL